MTTVDVFGWKRRRKAQEAAEAVEATTAQDDTEAEAKAKAEADRTAEEAAEAARAEAEAKAQAEQQEPQDDEQTTYTMTAEEVDAASIEDVKKLLDLYDVKYAHNTGEAKLRERLKDAIK